MSLPERLVSLRESRGFNKSQVAHGIGASPIGYCRYEYGERVPAYKQLIALADFYNVSMDYIAGRTDNPQIVR